MDVTKRQILLLTNIGRVTTRRKQGGKEGYFLVNEDCSATINSLLVRGLLVRSHGSRDLSLASHVNLLNMRKHAKAKDRSSAPAI